MVTEAEARRLRPFMSGVVALVVALAATIVWYFLGRPDETPTPIRTVPWEPSVQVGREAGQLAVYAPDRLPLGWRATRAEYDSRPNFPSWNLGLSVSTGNGDVDFVGVSESKEPISTLVEDNFNGDGSRGKDVVLSGVTWQTWTAKSGDYGLAVTVDAPSGGTESVLVFGSAPDDRIRDFAGTLNTD